MKKVYEISAETDLENLPEEVRDAVISKMRGVPDGIYVNMFVSAIARSAYSMKIIDCDETEFKKLSAVTANLAMNYHRNRGDNAAPGFINKVSSINNAIFMGLELLLRFKSEGISCCKCLTLCEKIDALYSKSTQVVETMIVNQAEADMYQNALSELLMDISHTCFSSTRQNYLNGSIKGIGHGMLQYLADSSYDICKAVWVNSDAEIAETSAILTDSIIKDIHARASDCADKCVRDVCAGVNYTNELVMSQAILKAKYSLAAVCLDKHNYLLYLKLISEIAALRTEFINLINEHLDNGTYTKLVADAASLIDDIKGVPQAAIKETCGGLLGIKRNKAILSELAKDKAKGVGINIKKDLFELFYPEMQMCLKQRENAIEKILKKVRSDILMGEEHV